MKLAFEWLGRKLDIQIDMPEQFLAGALDPHIVQFMMRVCRPGDKVIDGGAYVGYFTALMSKLVGPAGIVIAFEPGMNNIPFLHHNIALNELSNVVVMERALWSDTRSKTLYCVPLQIESDGGLVNSLSDPAPEKTVSLEVATTTLDQFLPARLIKLDIEGAEKRALECVSPALAPFIVCELNNETLPRMGDSCVALRQMMHGKGYDTFLLPVDGLPVLLGPHQGFVTDKVSADVLFSTPELVAELGLQS